MPGTRLALPLSLLLFGTGCATQWQPSGEFSRSVQTRLELSSEPPAQVFLEGRPVGVTPLEIPLDYQLAVEKQSRKVAYWRAEPGIAALLTVASMGLYAPFGAIPVTSEETLHATDRYAGNRFRIELRAPGHASWSQEVEARGEPALQVHAVLEPETPPAPRSRR